jgi:hypothetical protein
MTMRPEYPTTLLGILLLGELCLAIRLSPGVGDF